MNVWAIGKNGKPVTTGELSKHNVGFSDFIDEGVICATKKSYIDNTISDCELRDKGYEPVKIWSSK